MSTEIEKIREQILYLRNSLSSNKKCADCNNPGTIYVDIKFGCFLCSRCAGLHRKLDTNISRIKSIYFDTLRPEDYLLIKSVGGNNKFNKKFEKNRPSVYPKISDKSTEYYSDTFIHAKYAEKLFYDDEPTEPIEPKPTAPSIDTTHDLLDIFYVEPAQPKKSSELIDELSQLF